MLSATETATLKMIADSLNVNFNNLYSLIRFESNFNPKASNPYSSAKGLIQFTDETARSLGFSSSKDLVNKNPSVIDQLPLVHHYLQQFKPFYSKQSLYMSVFYPTARSWPSNKQFPDSITNVNPGILTPDDYIKHVDGKGGDNVVLPIVGGAVLLVYLFLKQKGFFK
jgi:hypothetical protein